MYYILMALLDECCGVDIMQKVDMLSHGRVQVGPGTLYAMLGKFEQHQMICKTAEEGRKKWYLITDKGLEMLQKEYRRLHVMVEDGAVYIENPSHTASGFASAHNLKLSDL